MTYLPRAPAAEAARQRRGTHLPGISSGCAHAPAQPLEYVGQSHILGPGQLLRRAIEADRIQSLIFYGPPGNRQNFAAPNHRRARPGANLSVSAAWQSNVADMRRVLSAAEIGWRTRGSPPSFSSTKSPVQQSAAGTCFLPMWRAGSSVIGRHDAQSFFLRQFPLVSRSQIFELQPLTEEELYDLLQTPSPTGTRLVT